MEKLIDHLFFGCSKTHSPCFTLPLLFFVNACNLLCSRAIGQSKLEELDKLLISFCIMFEQLFGAETCTPNLHLHSHLKDCTDNFGAATAFWLFGCERLNGILGSVPTNHHAIELQLMQKFLSNQKTLQSLSTESEDDLIKDLLGPFHFSQGLLKH